MTSLFPDGSDLPLFSGTPQAVTTAASADPRRSLDDLKRALRQVQIEQAQVAREVNALLVRISDADDDPSEAQLAHIEALIKRRTITSVRAITLEWVLGGRAKLD